MFEVEYKAAVAEVETLDARLRAHAAAPLGRRTEEDHYYQHPQRDFARSDEALRVRCVDGHRVLTYKGPRQRGPTRSREEVEVRLDGDIERVLLALGFRLAGKVRKVRTAHRVRDLTVTIDDVEGLGVYAEVEGMAAHPADVDTVRKAVLALAFDLGLGPEEPRSYLEMVLARPRDS